mgnify:CR=1 FL=1
MKIIFLSDTHTFHNHISVPDGDMVIHAGDYTSRGSIAEVSSFLYWFSNLPHRYKIFINGNHEYEMYENPSLLKAMIPDNVYYLENSSVVIEGIKIYGSPYTKRYGLWAYQYNTREDAVRIWDTIPEDADIIITHQPPYGILDKVPYNTSSSGLYTPTETLEQSSSQGCEDLLNKVRTVRPKLHVFGHIHESAGILTVDNTIFVNASICTNHYIPSNSPTVVEF